MKVSQEFKESGKRAELLPSPSPTEHYVNLFDYDIIVINTSGGKDSICSIWDILRRAKAQNYSKDRIILSHQDLGEAEWPGMKELLEAQSKFFGLRLITIKRVDYKGKEESFLEYAERRGMWPSNMQRWCTSDFKTGPGMKVVTALTKTYKKSQVLYVLGFRKEESPARAKKKEFSVNKKLTTLSRTTHQFLNIHNWTEKLVWRIIKFFKIPYHYAYDLGMPRLSCVFCIFSPFDALIIAGIANPSLLDKYIDAERSMGHSFRHEFSLQEVKDAIESGYKPINVKNWIM